MAKQRFYNARLLCMDGDMRVREGELRTEGARISYVGPSEGAPEEKFDRETDVCGNLILPGFKNAHTHSAMTFLRSFADDLPLADWLHQRVFPMEALLTGEDVYWFSRLAFMEYLSSGITADFDMYLYPEEVARASVDSGFRTVMISGLNDFCSSPEEVRENYDRFNHCHPLLSYRLGFHAEYTTSEVLLRKVARMAEELRAPVFSHNSETAAEVEGCRERYGMTPTALMESLGMFEYGGGGYHCIYLDDGDLEIFQRRRLTAVINPASNLKLASGIPGTAEFLRRGIPVAIGTDGPASNNCLDMFREMFLVTGLAKLKERDASAAPAEEVLKMACVNGARCMGLQDGDCLAAGKLADLTIIDLRQPNMQPMNDIVKNVVYSGSKQNILLTMVGGEVLYEKGEFLIHEDPERIYREAGARIERMQCHQNQKL